MKNTNIESMLVRELNVKYLKHTKKDNQIKISNSSEGYQFFKNITPDEEISFRESFYMICLSKSNNVIGWYKISTGGTSGTFVDKKIIFSIALNCLASAVIIGHNHPSGNIKPSDADKSITKQLCEGGKLLDINILDHVVFTEETYFSFADEGLI